MRQYFERFKVRRLQVDILTAFSVLFLFASITILWITYTRNTETILLFSENILKTLEKDTTHHMQDLFGLAQNVAEEGSVLVHSENDISLTPPFLTSYMLGVLKFNENLDNYYFGTMNGNFLEAIRIFQNSQFPSDYPVPFPPNTKYVIRYINRKVTPPIATWIFMEEDFKVIQEKKWMTIEYDPRLRPWYVDTPNNNNLAWTDVYVFNESRHKGITASIPIHADNGQIYAVVGVDLSLEQVSEYLREEPIGKTGQSLIMTQTGQIIASSFDIKSTEKGADFPSVFNLDNPIYAAAYQYSLLTKQSSFIFEYNSIKYLVLFTTLDFQSKEPWVIGIIAPMSDFLENIIEINHHAIFILLVIFIGSVFIIYFISKRIAKPIIQLSYEIDKIREFELESPIHIPSHIREIIQITESVSTLKAAIREFSHFVPKQLVQQLVMKGRSVRKGGHRKEITIFFSDIFNFTAIAENMSPEKLMLHLSEYLNEMSEIIMSHSGTIDKYSGDNIMAFWGAPTHDKDQALHACTTALLCQRRLTDLNQKWHLEERPLLLTRIGIHKGEVIVGNIGSSDRINYTVIGDAVNVASRLESINKIYHTKIIISQEILQEVEGTFLVRPLDIASFKGKTKGIKIYELIAKLKGDAALLPEHEQTEFCQQFEQAFATFHTRHWQEALTLFLDLQKNHPQDVPTQIYIERCQAFIKNPPPGNWDGITNFEVK